MKQIIPITSIFLLAMFISLQIQAQKIGDLDGINYQAVALDEDGKEIVGKDIKGKPLHEQEIGVRFTIQKGEEGAVQYQETHTTTTDKNGMFSLVIGKGEQTGSGQYTELLNIPWIDADQWLKVEISTQNDGDYRLVSLQKFMTVPYSFYTDDIADNAITTSKILDRTIQTEDIDTSAVTSGEILDRTIKTEDINTEAVTTNEILDRTVLTEDIDSGAVTSNEIRNRTIAKEDISTGAVTSEEILNETIQNEDIKDSTIDLSAKVRDTLAVENGGTGQGTLEDGGFLLGNGTGPIKPLPRAEAGQIPVGTTDEPVLKLLAEGSGIKIEQKTDSVIISSTISGGVNADGVETVDIGVIAAGDTYTSQSFPVPGANAIMGDIILASIDKNLQGCIMTPYLISDNSARIAIFNGTGTNVNLGNNVEVKVLIVK